MKNASDSLTSIKLGNVAMPISMVFHRHNAEHAYLILKERAKQAFKDGVVPKETLNTFPSENSESGVDVIT